MSDVICIQFCYAVFCFGYYWECFNTSMWFIQPVLLFVLVILLFLLCLHELFTLFCCALFCSYYCCFKYIYVIYLPIFVVLCFDNILLFLVHPWDLFTQFFCVLFWLYCCSCICVVYLYSFVVLCFVLFILLLFVLSVSMWFIYPGLLHWQSDDCSWLPQLPSTSAVILKDMGNVHISTCISWSPTSTEIPVINVRQSHNCHTFIMLITIPRKTFFIQEASTKVPTISISRCHLTSIGNSIVEIRRS